MPLNSEEAKLSRFLVLRFWLRGLGCCSFCAMRLSIAQVEKEAGFKFVATGHCGDEGKCTPRAREGWKTMPKPEAPEVKAA